MPATVELKSPLATHNGQVTTIELRDLTAADMVECRTAPVSITEVTTGVGNTRTREMKYEFRYDVVMTCLARLSGIDQVLLGALGAADFQKCANAVSSLWNVGSGE